MAIPAASSRQDLLLAATALVASLAFLDVTVVNVALPDIGRSFGTRDLVDLSWCVTAYAAVFAAALVPAGRLADVLGHRRMLIARTSAFGAASAVAAAAPSLAVLVAARVVQAIAAGLTAPASSGLLLDGVPKRAAPAPWASGARRRRPRRSSVPPWEECWSR